MPFSADPLLIFLLTNFRKMGIFESGMRERGSFAQSPTRRGRAGKVQKNAYFGAII
jgi:hypothetical protein